MLKRPVMKLPAHFSHAISLAAVIFCAAALPALCAVHDPASLSGPPAQTGLYLYIGHPDLSNFDAQYSAALPQDYIDGAAIMVQWQEIEPQPGVYDFTYFDKWIVPTLALNKKLSLGVVAGIFTPQWLYGLGYGVPRNEFQYDRSETGTGGCSAIAQPTFWDPMYLAEYGKMMQALSDHLHTFQGGAAYSALRLIKLSGINNTTEELRIDASGPSFEACQTDSVAAWAAAGFTPAVATNAMLTLAAETAQAFPDKLQSLAVIHRNAFPPIDNNGQVYTKVPVPDALTATMLAALIPLYKGQLLVQWDALYQNGTVPEVVNAGKAGARIGWQMNGFEGAKNGSGCVYSKPFRVAACQTVADFQAILDTGISTGGYYIEVQAGSVDNATWNPAFEEGHMHLLAATANLPF